MPHFSIDAQAETVPLSPQTLYNTLAAATGQNHQLLQTSTQQLQNWEKAPGYYSLLQDVFIDQSLPEDIRYLSIIQLKNGIDRYWRKTAQNALPKEEKLQIRTRALDAGTREPSRPLNLHNGLLLAKIARYEFPHDWPELITSLISHLRAATTPTTKSRYLKNTLYTLLQVIKELSTARLQRTRTSLQQVTPELLQVVGGIYVQSVETWTRFLNGGGDDEGSALESVEHSLLSLKVLRRLIIAGFEHPNRDSDVDRFWTIAYQHFGQFFQIVSGSQIDTNVNNMVLKHLSHFSKLHIDMARTHPAAFVLLPGCFEITQTYLTLIQQLGEQYRSTGVSATAKIGTDGDADEGKTMLEKLGLKGLLLVRAFVKMAYNPVQTFKYQHPQDKEERKAAVDLVKKDILSEVFVNQMMELIITKFFVFRESDLRDWEEEPEEWEKREEEIADAWEFSVRSCSEKLFLDLIMNFKEMLVPRLLQVFYQYATPDNQDVFLKDSLYSAIGLAGPFLDQTLDFNSFLKTTLAAEFQMTRPNYNVLRRRIAILLGHWVPIKPAELDRRLIYQIFQTILNPEDRLNDQVVRVTAGRQLQKVLEPFEFEYSDFEPFAATLLARVVGLVSEVELTETKMALLETTRVAIVKMETHISPFADDIMSMLPPLWQESEEEHLFKQQILTLVTAIISSLKNKSLRFQPMILPLIQQALQPDSETLVYLMEEALDLWSAIIQQTPTDSASPELLSMTSTIFPLLGLGTESLRQTLDIADSYILLSPATVISPAFLDPFLSSLASLIQGTNSTTTSSRQLQAIIPHLLENLVHCLAIIPDHQRSAALRQILSSSVSSSLLPHIVSSLHDCFAYHAAGSPPNRKAPYLAGDVAETDYLRMLSRMILAEPTLAVEAITAAGPASDGPKSTDSTMRWLLTEWFAHFDSIADINSKKLQVLALTNLISVETPGLSGPPRFVLENLQGFITVWTDIIVELGEAADGDEAADPSKRGDYLVFYNDKSGTPAYEPPPDEVPEEKRRRDISSIDPIHTINIRLFVAEKFKAAVQGAGGEEAFTQQWLKGDEFNVDGVVLSAFLGLGLF